MSRPFINSGVSQIRHLQRLVVSLTETLGKYLAECLAAHLGARFARFASIRIRFQAEYEIQQSPIRVTCGEGEKGEIKEKAKDLDLRK